MSELYMWWTTPEACLDHIKNLAGAGGWFDARYEKHTWQDFLEMYKSNVHPHLEMLRADIIKRDIWQCGDWHQLPNTECVPVFSDGCHYSGTFRAWGDLMAAVWSSHYGKPYTYMSFYNGKPPEKPV